ncbi:MAG: tetratricopeptide repeat protein [Pseudomonadales bacterium]|nr:tetratricopeptide repeat protein [Pseudomonadales bacterium]MCP5330069.1 tetratricopeptide repeat protein [Pseudomonadales bacterium]MCP5343021.1 tetratricopeptide repeat protein [Pseudomonadales bacterium]
MAFSTEEEETLETLKRWWNESGKSLALGVVVFAVGYMGWAQWQSMQTSESAAASDLYEALGTTVVLGPGVELTEASVASARQLIAELKEEHGDSVYALYGALFGARLAVDDRDLDTAEQELQWLLDNARTGYFSPTDESLLITARLRLARVILSKGEAQRALDLLASFSPGAFEAEYAEIQGDAFYALERPVEARASYEQALQAGSTSETLQMKLDDIALDS